MGKYMRRKCSAAAGNKESAVEIRPQVMVGGVLTRSRFPATLARVATGAAPKRRKQATTTARAVQEVDGAAASCYLHLRSRKLFIMPPAAVVAPHGSPRAEEASMIEAPEGSVDSGEAVVDGISRCSSTASRSGGAAEACEGRNVESSVDSDSGCGRERRELTPSSGQPGDFNDLESSQAADEQTHQRRRYPVTAETFHPAQRARIVPADEIEDFFAAAEKAEAERFAAKYNFDVVRGVPLNAGRFQWTPVAAAEVELCKFGSQAAA